MVAQPNPPVSQRAHGTERGSSDQIRSEIDCAREQLDGTLEELTHRLTPEQLMRRTFASCQSAAWSGAGRAMNVVKQHPVPAAVIGIGVLWMLKESLASPRRSSYPTVAPPRGAVSQIGDHVASAAEGVKHAGSVVADAVTSAGSTVKEVVTHTGSYVGEAASAAGSKAQRMAQQTAKGTRRLAHDYPLAAASACFALGLAGGLSVPRTRKEDELFGDTRDHLLQKAQGAGSELLRKGEQAVEKAATTVEEVIDRKSQELTQASTDGRPNIDNGTDQSDEPSNSL